MGLALLAQLRERGLRVSTQDGLLLVEPRSLLTDELRGQIRAGKAALIHELADELIANREAVGAFGAALIMGHLVICANCARFLPNPDATALGRCGRLDVESWAFAPFACGGFAVSKRPALPEFIPDPDGARARARGCAK
jgi:hypothetical protein